MALAGGVPWESTHGGMLGRWWETATAANFRAKGFYAAVADGDDPMPACLFSTATGAIVGSIFGLLGLMAVAVFSSLMLSVFGKSGGKAVITSLVSGSIGISAIAWATLVMVFAIGGFIGPWVVGGIHHLVLLMVNGVGPGKTYAHTVRVNAYATAGAMFLLPIPFFGPMMAAAFHVINHITGYEVVHGCGGGKAFLAWFTPNLTCCCCYWGLFLVAATL